MIPGLLELKSSLVSPPQHPRHLQHPTPLLLHNGAKTELAVRPQLSQHTNHPNLYRRILQVSQQLNSQLLQAHLIRRPRRPSTNLDLYSVWFVLVIKQVTNHLWFFETPLNPNSRIDQWRDIMF